jgi:hypothetical protein
MLPADLGVLSREAYAVARGRVVAVDARWTNAERRAVETIVTLEAETYLKGQLPATLQFRVPGGRLGRYRNLVIGAPEFSVGQHVIVFLGAKAPGLPYVLGLSQGVFRVASASGELVVTSPWVLPTAGPPTRIVRGDTGRRPTPLAEFESRVRTLVGDPR